MGHVLGFIGGFMFGNGLVVTIFDIFWGRPLGLVETLVGIGLILIGLRIELNK